MFTRCPTSGRKQIACIYGLRSEGVKRSNGFGVILLYSDVYYPQEKIVLNVYLVHGIHQTVACIYVIQQMSQPRVACCHGYQQNSHKTECVLRRPPIGG